MTQRIFCTYFDSNFLTRGLALYTSLQAHCSAFTLWVVCCDQQVYDRLAELRLPSVQLLTLDGLEQRFPELLRIKSTRKLVEYYFTITPFVVQAVLERVPAGELVTYLDADMAFFASPEPLFAEIGAANVAIIEHRYAPHQTDLNDKYGRFNVGWVTVRHNQIGFAVLHRWGEQCIEWCYDVAVPGKFGDQKYLDTWPTDYPGVHIIQHAGANVATWNVMNYRHQFRAGQVLLDGQPLIFYHFHGFKKKMPWLYDTNAALHAVRLDSLVRRQIYGPYIRLNRRLARQYKLRIAHGVRARPPELRTNQQQAIRPRGFGRVKRVLTTIRDGQQVIVLAGQVL